MQFVTGSVSVRFPPPPLPPPIFFFLPKTVRSEFVNRFQQLSAVVKGKRVVLCVLLSFPRLRSWHENPVPSSVFDRSGRRWCFELEHGTHEKLIISSKAPRENGQKRKVLFFLFFLQTRPWALTTPAPFPPASLNLSPFPWSVLGSSWPRGAGLVQMPYTSASRSASRQQLVFFCLFCLLLLLMQSSLCATAPGACVRQDYWKHARQSIVWLFWGEGGGGETQTRSRDGSADGGSDAGHCSPVFPRTYFSGRGTLEGGGELRQFVASHSSSQLNRFRLNQIFLEASSTIFFTVYWQGWQTDLFKPASFAQFTLKRLNARFGERWMYRMYLTISFFFPIWKKYIQLLINKMKYKAFDSLKQSWFSSRARALTHSRARACTCARTERERETDRQRETERERERECERERESFGRNCKLVSKETRAVTDYVLYCIIRQESLRSNRETEENSWKKFLSGWY